jgi:hypothetical protein
MEYDAEKTPFRNAPSIPNLPVVDANNVQSKPATTVPSDGKRLFLFHVSKPGCYGLYRLGEGYGMYELGEGMGVSVRVELGEAMVFLPTFYGDENSSKRKRE